MTHKYKCSVVLLADTNRFERLNVNVESDVQLHLKEIIGRANAIAIKTWGRTDCNQAAVISVIHEEIHKVETIL
jgi:hypothetical protein